MMSENCREFGNYEIKRVVSKAGYWGYELKDCN